MKSRNCHTHKKSVEKGLSIYKTGRSKFWQARLWDRRSDKYVTKTTGEVDRHEAILTARKWKDAYLQKAVSHLISNATSEDAFEYYARMIPAHAKDDWVILRRPNDGILAYFGDYNVAFITTGSIRTYLEVLDANRPAPLSNSTLKKHVIIVRKALRFAREDGKILSIPESPKLKACKNRPRPGFEPDDFHIFYQYLINQRDAGNLTNEFIRITSFIIFTFVRPTVNELMGIRVKDVTIRQGDKEEYLEVKVSGKTGFRIAASMPNATNRFKKQVEQNNLSSNDYLWYPKIQNRETAYRKFSQKFTNALKESEFQITPDGQKRTAYSLRHFALTARLQSSGGKVNIFALAKNAGTSVQMLEQHYIKYLTPSKKIVANLQYIDD